ncbi:serine/threonine protein kinase [Streptomyces cinnamoneus]|uniref:serine/threonine protein kinase n=1 Tax=Streptomyces cinnamoneus TaxID=53446 RepID=UPI0037BB46EB
MEPLRHDDPRLIGPYTVVARLDPPDGDVPVPEDRFLARSADGDRTVLVGTALAGADAGRFAVETEGARRLIGAWSGPWFAPLTDAGEQDGLPWHACAYLPVLPLPAVLAAHGGPLPERTVRALGAALAEALLTLHSGGVAHAGLSPAAVLVTADGPRLTCFGALRAAAPAGQQRSGLPGVTPGTVAPEGAAGGPPHPAGDVFALGAVLAYATTGHTVPERSELPEGLRGTISACLAGDPAGRPRAERVLDELTGTAPAGAGASGAVPRGRSRAAALFGPGWLPGRVVTALVRQSAALLTVDTSLPGASLHR